MSFMNKPSFINDRSPGQPEAADLSPVPQKSLSGIGKYLEGTRRPRRCRGAAEGLIRVSPSPGQDLFYAVGILVQCQVQASKDSLLSTSDREMKAREYIDRAAALLKDSVAVSSEDHRILNNLAWYLSMCPTPQLRDPALAVELARKATERAPNFMHGWGTLGAARYRAGDWDESIEALSRSIELSSGGVPVHWLILAMAHWQRGDKDKARSWYDKAIAWMDKNDSKDEELLSSDTRRKP